MKPPFSFYSFKETVNEYMLERAVQIFNKNEVENLSQFTPGNWTANITGMRVYTIKVKIQDENIVSCSCNCPYDLDPVCKHIVTVMIAIEKLHPEQVTPDFEERYTRIVENILKRMDFNQVLWDNIIKNRVKPELSLLIEKAESYITGKDYEHGISIYRVMIRQIFSLIKRNGRSSSTLIDIISEICDNLIKIEHALTPGLKEELFYLCENEYLKLEELEYFQIPESFFTLFRKMVFNQDIEAEFFTFIDSKNRKDDESFKMSDHYRHLLKARISFLEDNERYEEALQVREDQKDDYSFLNELILFEIERKNYEKAKQFALDDVKGKRSGKGFKSRWDSYLLRIAMETNNLDEIRLYSERLYFQHRSTSAYRVLKSTYPNENEWRQKVETIIQKSGIRKKFKYNSIIINLARIFIEENYWDRLIELFKEFPDHLWILSAYSVTLPPEYAAEIKDMHQSIILPL